MSKSRLAAGILAVVAIVAAGMAVTIAKQQESKDTRAARVEYTVAAVSTAAESVAVSGPRFAVPARRRGLGSIPDTLTLVVVGGLLLGLAAAVRRTA